MRKLKVALILLFSLLMSLALFACGGGKEPDPTPGPGDGEEETEGNIRQVTITSGSVLTFTDGDTSAAWEPELAKVVVSARIVGETAAKTIAISDCTLTGVDTIQWATGTSYSEAGTVGTYYVTVTPKNNNPNNYSATIEVNIEHDFDENGLCGHCGATKTTEEINVSLMYKSFHDGPASFSSDSSLVTAFGTVDVEGYAQEVKTITVGRLEKGMSITIHGHAQNNFRDYNLEDLQYYFPILGFATRYDTTYNGSTIGQYNGGAGTSMIVRHEGWVLQDGIGQPRMLAAIAGGGNDTLNYDSHSAGSATGRPEGYGTGTPTSVDEWIDWYTYSEGDISRSSAYDEEQEVEYTWTYRQDGVIELTFAILGSNATTLVARTKVPDAEYYDTILHGEYVTMSFDKITTIQTTTLTDIRYVGASDTVYLSNQMLNTADLSVSRQTMQQGDAWNAITSFDVYGTYAYDADSAEDTVWVSLKSEPLSSDMVKFKISHTVGNTTKEVLIDPENFVTILENAVDSIVDYPVSVEGVTLAGNTVASASYAVKTVGEANAVEIILSGNAGSLSAADKTALGATAGKYVSFRIWARKGATAFNSGTYTVTSGGTALAGAKVVVGTENGVSYADVVLPVDSSIAASGIVISGLQELDIHVNLSGVGALTVTSSVAGAENVRLNAGGDVTITYSFGDWYDTLKSGERLERMQVYVNSVSGRVNQMTDTDGVYTDTIDGVGVKISFNDTAKTVTVVYSIPAATLTNIKSYTLQLWAGESANALQATDTINYALAFANDVEGETGIVLENAYMTVSGNKLYYVVAGTDKNVTSAGIANNYEAATINVNAGEVDYVNLISLAGSVVDGQFVLDTSASYVSSTLTVFGTLDNALDSDTGYVIVFEIDLSALQVKASGTSTEYYFEVVGSGESVPTSFYKTTGNGITVVTIGAGELGEQELIKEGNCKEVSYVAYIYSKDAVSFYAGLSVVGGSHDFDENGVCRLCGATQKTFEVKKWGSTTTFTLKQNMEMQFDVDYADAVITQVYQGFVVRIYNIALDTEEFNWIFFRPDAFVTCDYGTAVSSNNVTTVADWKTEWGEGMDTSGLKSALPNGRLVVNITLVDGTLTFTETLYRAGETQYYFTFSAVITGITSSSVTVAAAYDSDATSTNVIKDNTATVTYGSITNNAISAVEDSAITVKGVEFAATGAEYAVNGVADGYSIVAASGVASTLSEAQANALGVSTEKYSHYVAFEVQLGETQLTDWKAALVGQPGYVAFGDDYNVLYVVIPIDGSITEYTIDLINFKASTLQSDIKIDLANVAVSDITSTVNTDSLYVTGGTATITYDGSIPEGAVVEIGGTSNAISALTSATSFGGGISAAYANQVLTLTVSKPDFEEALPVYTVNLRSSDGKLLYQNTIELSAIPSGLLSSEGIYVEASAAKLVFVFDAETYAGGTELTFNANKGENTAADDLLLIKNYNLGFNAKGFTDTNLVTTASGIVYSANGVVAVTVDLSVLGIGVADQYGFELSKAEDVFVVSAERAITKAELDTSAVAATVMQADCTTDGLLAKSYVVSEKAVVYYDVTFVDALGHEWEAVTGDALANYASGYDVVYACKHGCGSVKYEQNDNDQAITTVWGGSSSGTSYDGWGTGAAAGWIAYGTIYQGGIYYVEGTNLSNATSTWHIPAIGFSSASASDSEQGLRFDNYQFDQNNVLFNAVWTAYDNEAGKSITSLSSYIKYYNNAQLSVLIDYSAKDTIIAQMNLVNGEECSLTLTFTITANAGSTLASSYKLYDHADGNMYTPSLVYQVVPEDCTPYAPLSKHVHSYDPVTDRCAYDGELNPNHGDTANGGLAHNYDPVTDRCTICGALNPDHVHTYGDDGFCNICGAFHLDTDADNIAASVTVGDTTYTGTLTNQSVVNNDPDITWWNGNTSSFSVSGDFQAVLAWQQLTIDTYLWDAIVELSDGTNYFDAQFMFDGSGAAPWGSLFSTPSRTVTLNGEETDYGTISGKGEYAVFITRIGDTLTVQYMLTEADTGRVWVVTDVHSNFTTANLTVGVVGNPYACENIVGLAATLTPVSE